MSPTSAPLLDVAALHALIDEIGQEGRPLVLLDVRWALDGSKGEHDHLAGHLPGAVYVDLGTELAAASAGHGDVALVSADLRELDRDALAHLAGHGVTVIGASRDGNEADERHLRQLGVDRHIHLATPREELVETLSSGGSETASSGLAVPPGWPMAEDPPTAPIEPVTDDTPPPAEPPPQAASPAAAPAAPMPARTLRRLRAG